MFYHLNHKWMFSTFKAEQLSSGDEKEKGPSDIMAVECACFCVSVPLKEKEKEKLYRL